MTLGSAWKVDEEFDVVAVGVVQVHPFGEAVVERHPYEQSADTAWAIGSIDVVLLQRAVLDWDATRHARWLRDTLVDQLLRPTS